MQPANDVGSGGTTPGRLGTLPEDLHQSFIVNLKLDSDPLGPAFDDNPSGQSAYDSDRTDPQKAGIGDEGVTAPVHGQVGEESVKSKTGSTLCVSTRRDHRDECVESALDSARVQPDHTDLAPIMGTYANWSQQPEWHARKSRKRNRKHPTQKPQSGRPKGKPKKGKKSRKGTPPTKTSKSGATLQSLGTVLSFPGMMTTNHEATFSARVFPDYKVADGDPGVFEYWLDAEQSYIGQPGSAQRGLSRPRSVTVYALPRAVPSDTATTTYLAQYVTPANIIETTGTNLKSASVANTVVHPDFKQSFVKIGHTNFDHFDSTLFKPVSGGPNNDNWLLFQLRLVDPTSGNTLTSAVQLCVEILFSQSFSVIQTLRNAHTYAVNFPSLKDPEESEFTDSVSQVTLKGVTNRT